MHDNEIAGAGDTIKPMAHATKLSKPEVERRGAAPRPSGCGGSSPMLRPTAAWSTS